MKSRPTWSIGELAAKFGLETHVLRHWESMGLLAPLRDGAGRRRYGEGDLVRVAVIVRNKAAGMSLEQVRALLDPDPAVRHRVLQRHLDELAGRMREMERSREMTEHAMRCRAHDITSCPRFRAGVDDLISS